MSLPDKMILFGQWGGACAGRPNSADRPLEADNRDELLARVFPVQRVCVLVKRTGFNSMDTNSLCQWQSYADIFARLARTGTKVALTFGLHNQGWDSGRHYHDNNDPDYPIFDPGIVDQNAEQFWSWYQDDPAPKPVIFSWALGNEVEYDRSTGAYQHSLYWNCWTAANSHAPSDIQRISAGNFLHEFINPNQGSGPRTLNGWLAQTRKAQQYDIWLDGHFNGQPIATTYPELRELADKYGVITCCTEDRSFYQAQHCDALARGREVDRAGSPVYGGFGPRCNRDIVASPWPHNKSTWQVNGQTGPQYNRANVGVEGAGDSFASPDIPARTWNAANYHQWKLLAQYLGTYISGPPINPDIDIPEEPPMPDPDKALGEDKMMAMLQAHSASVHGATQAARDRALVRAKKFYREWYALVVGIPAASPGEDE